MVCVRMVLSATELSGLTTTEQTTQPTMKAVVSNKTDRRERGECFSFLASTIASVVIRVIPVRSPVVGYLNLLIKVGLGS